MTFLLMLRTEPCGIDK